MTKNMLKVRSTKPIRQSGDLDQKSKSFLESMTTFHGTSHFVHLGWTGRMLWLLVLMCIMIGSITFLMAIKDRYNSDQIVTKIYSDWTVDKVPFPSVTICNLNVVSRRESKAIKNILQENFIPQADIDSFFRDLPHLIHFTLGSANISNHTEEMNILKTHFYSTDTIMEEVHQQCEDLLIYCEFNSKEKDCKELFTLIRTVSGYCCSFSLGGIETDQEEQSVFKYDDDLEYYYDQGTDEPIKTNMIATSQAGRSSGLRAVFNVEPSDYGDYGNSVMGGAYGAKIFINDPNDYIETRYSFKWVSIGESVDMKVEPFIYQCEDALRGVDPAKRGCWFYDEVELLHTSRYSYETCHTECRSNSYLEFCGCVPYKYPSDKTHRTCDFSDLHCLYYMRVNWEQTRKHCKQECYKECRDKEYQVTNDVVPFLAESYPEKVTKGRNVSELAGVHVYYLKSTCNCYMMILLTDTNTFIATYGGIFSVGFGVSIVSVLELIYLSAAFFIKVIRYLIRNRKSVKEQRKN